MGFQRISTSVRGYKRRMNALETASEQVPAMIQRALTEGVSVEHVLMDSWFTMPPLIKDIVDQGLEVIDMVKATKHRYSVDKQLVDLKKITA